MRSRINSLVHSSLSIVIALFLVVATSISVIEIGSNQSQTAMAQQQQQSQANQTYSVLKQQPNLSGTSFDIDNMTMSSNMIGGNMTGGNMTMDDNITRGPFRLLIFEKAPLWKLLVNRYTYFLFLCPFYLFCSFPQLMPNRNYSRVFFSKLRKVEGF
jgi:predicted PurR-regulated permease PerM